MAALCWGIYSRQSLFIPTGLVEKIFRSMMLAVFHHHTYRRYARPFVEPAVVHKWKTTQNIIIENLKAQTVILGGDMRAVSPGHPAKFGSYTMMDLRSKSVIDVQLVQSNKVGGNYHMELEGLKSSLALLNGHSLPLNCVVTDRHPQVQKHLREDDKRHIIKGLSKRRVTIAKTTKIHNHNDPAFPQCLHPLCTSRRQKGMAKTRLYLKALHFNENNHRLQATTSSGEPMHRTSSPKFKNGEQTTTPETFNYVDDIMKLVSEQVFQDPEKKIEKINIPPTLSSQHRKTREANSGFSPGVPLQSRTGLNSTYWPSSSGDTCLNPQDNTHSPTQISPIRGHKTPVCTKPVTTR